MTSQTLHASFAHRIGSFKDEIEPTTPVSLIKAATMESKPPIQENVLRNLRAFADGRSVYFPYETVADVQQAQAACFAGAPYGPYLYFAGMGFKPVQLLPKPSYKN